MCEGGEYAPSGRPSIVLPRRQRLYCDLFMRTARSRTSGENFDFLILAPSSQIREPSRKPGRFIAALVSQPFKGHFLTIASAMPFVRPSRVLLPNCGVRVAHSATNRCTERSVELIYKFCSMTFSATVLLLQALLMLASINSRFPRR